MKYYFLLFAIWSSSLVFGQEIQWSSLKYSDAIALIPSMTGYHGGSISVAHRNGLNHISGAPSTSMALAHHTFSQDKIGAGIVLINENVNVLQTMQASIPLAYHLKTTSNTGFSFGIKTGLQQRRLNLSKVNTLVQSDDVLQSYGNKTRMNFDFSSQFNHKFFQIGFSYLDLIKKEKTTSTTKVLFTNIFIPIKDEFDLLEPTIMLCQDKNGKWNFMSYVYYTLVEKIIVGAGYKSGNQYLASLGFSFQNRFIFGYNYEYNASTYHQNLGNSHELTFRMNFNQRYYNQRKYSILSKPIQGMDVNKH